MYLGCASQRVMDTTLVMLENAIACNYIVHCENPRLMGVLPGAIGWVFPAQERIMQVSKLSDDFNFSHLCHLTVPQPKPA